MKIVCIGRNYAAHAKELGNAIPEEPVFFLKPETAILDRGASFKIPAWSNNIHYELELVFRISRECRNAQVKDLSAYVDGVTIGLDLTARDVQDELKKKGLPWEKAKAFDGSAVIGDRFIELPKDISSIAFRLEKNGAIVQKATAADMIHSPAALIGHVSRFMTLERGDLLFTGTPAGVGKLEKGDRLVGYLDGYDQLKLAVE